jgi:mRNA interferase RelE/StbE
MAIYRIEWKSSAIKELKRIDKSKVPRIIIAVESLVANPRPVDVRKLKGSERSFRIRVGDYRIVYEILDDSLVVCIIRIRHRKDVYRDDI